MAQYDETDKGVLYKNDKGDNPKRPDYRGSLNVGGTDYWISGWIREAGPNTKRPGEKFMSLSVEPKDERYSAKSAPLPDDDVPF